MSADWSIPQYLTHYHRGQPFRTLTQLQPAERVEVIKCVTYSEGAAESRTRD
jgi:hypothetical protein